jgi:hypothetical protein
VTSLVKSERTITHAAEPSSSAFLCRTLDKSGGSSLASSSSSISREGLLRLSEANGTGGGGSDSKDGIDSGADRSTASVEGDQLWSPFSHGQRRKARTVRSYQAFLFPRRLGLLLLCLVAKAEHLRIPAALGFTHQRSRLQDMSQRDRSAHFFLTFLRSSRSRCSRADSRRRCSCLRRSAAVMRGTMSSNGLSRISMLLIFGG